MYNEARRINLIKGWLKYLRCRFWRRHKFHRLEVWQEGLLMAYDDALVGCRQCDLWHWIC